ncbi:MAG: hypothetical protein AAFN09_02990 [Pseudomonadota bacterium]
MDDLVLSLSRKYPGEHEGQSPSTAPQTLDGSEARVQRDAGRGAIPNGGGLTCCF